MTRTPLKKPDCLCAECLDIQVNDPRATHEELIEFGNRDRKRNAYSKPSVSLRVRNQMAQYMEIVVDDTEAMFFGYLQMERLGLAWFYLATTKAGVSEWRLV